MKSRTGNSSAGSEPETGAAWGARRLDLPEGVYETDEKTARLYTFTREIITCAACVDKAAS